MQLALVLHNIRSVYNVGSMFRTADAAGVGEIILSGYTPTPLDRFGRARSDLAKVALGAEKYLKWKYVKTLSPELKKLKGEGYELIALEQAKGSRSIFGFTPTGKKLVLIVGNEVRGMSKALLKNVDTVLEIPMHGKKESLNVSVAAGVALFALANTQG